LIFPVFCGFSLIHKMAWSFTGVEIERYFSFVYLPKINRLDFAERWWFLLARRKQMTDTLKGQISNEEREQRQQHEEKLKGISPLKENPPYWLSTMAKNEWIRIYPHIIELPISELDRTLLAMYCNSYAQYRQALEDVAKEGQVVFEVNSKGFEVKKKNPSIEIMMQMSKEIRAIAGQLGLALDARLRLIGLGDDSEEDDIFEAMRQDDDD
ncbi:phage terminase small subunit P27 family, partial [Bacillus altitudinis]|uniref:phage terminase small subunit P27 family n=1 Tax=Bacillus altitudinis TaxID=293387 RepID=UPI0039A2F9F5